MIVFHVCSYKKLQKYLKTGAITPPVRAWENIEQAERNIHDFISKAQVDDYMMLGSLITAKAKEKLAEKDKRIAELEAKIKKMEYWWEELSGRRRINKSRACGVSHEILAKQSITKHRNLKSNS